jgi:hypothetical protein
MLIEYVQGAVKKQQTTNIFLSKVLFYHLHFEFVRIWVLCVILKNIQTVSQGKSYLCVEQMNFKCLYQIGVLESRFYVKPNMTATAGHTAKYHE